MSFLRDLQKQKRSLRNTETVVTYADGTKYIEKYLGPNDTKVVPQNSAIGFVVDTAPDDVPALVMPYLYVGSQDCCIPDVLINYNIRTVLSVGIEAPVVHSNVSYSHVQCLDLPDTRLIPILNECNQIIEKSIAAKENILVHCNAGVSRSASVVIGYLILQERKSFEDAHDMLKAVRPCIRPNIGFIKQLKSLHENR